ncbi:protein kinase domain protein [Ichthyophthirius multifiliis]|uniref:Calcium-dependent protein kinase 1 n=1 Tax=Ichthyophthirius multifiliis TaxID=5932 RepID=G0QQZ4_ICHMU|nr:protein kinase domain protein [Ichthyophthirius multifiliis]EGR32359.1 protein kinase domain protein [Ichthyophthirius multifiliis]|eukprot:XP_004035845.1 protein kinase domain protein [Ichthyophthirius multifiliis]
MVRQNNQNILEFYQLGKVLGEGGFGIVCLVTHKTTGIIRAMKMIKKEKLNKIQEDQLFEELNIVKQIDNPYIIKIFEHFEDDKNHYLITEYCTGGELFERIKDVSPFTEKVAANYMKQILSAISYCHFHKIVHRDLKPENILFDKKQSNSNLKVIDFGASTKFNPDQKLTKRIGTPFYVAPEILTKTPYDEKCDVWSLGVILYIMLCGYPPFFGYSDQEIYEKVKKGKYEFYSEDWNFISKEAKDLISKMLQYNPINRISAAEAYAHPWISQNRNVEQLDDKIMKKLCQFQAKSKLRAAILQLMANQVINTQEKEQMVQYFDSLDTNGDGMLSREELIQGYTNFLNGDFIKAQQIVEDSFKDLDLDGSGKVEFTEFLVASLQKEKLQSKDRIEQAFKLIDQDNNGQITKKELEDIMGGIVLKEQVWNNLLKDCDQNNDGMVFFFFFDIKNNFKRFHFQNLLIYQQILQIKNKLFEQIYICKINVCKKLMCQYIFIYFKQNKKYQFNQIFSIFIFIFINNISNFSHFIKQIKTFDERKYILLTKFRTYFLKKIQNFYKTNKNKNNLISYMQTNKTKINKACHQYDFLRIPPNWELAKIHAQSRETKPELKSDLIQDICQCCGYEIQRQAIGLNVDLIELGFLGSGFPLFYNYLKNCIAMLTVLFLIQGIPSIIQNVKGNFCRYTSLEAFEHAHHQKKHPKENYKELCVFNSIVKYSIANIIDEPNNSSFAVWSLIAMICQILMTIYFRKQQKDMDCIVDENNITPADYSVLVQNIPKDMPNIKDTLKRLFTYQSNPKQDIRVSKIVLIYDIKEIIEIEEEIDEIVKNKQKILSQKFDLTNPEVLELDHKIHELHNQLHKMEREVEHNASKFTGQAIISFETEQEKNLVLENNSINFFKRFINYFKNGQSVKYNTALYLKDRHLYIQQAPEPAEIDWEFAHCSTKEKIIARIGTNLLTILLVCVCFAVIALLSYLQSKLIDEAYEQLFEEQLKHQEKNKKDEVNSSRLYFIYPISFLISFLIVIFNKFCLPFTIHQIVDHEKWLTKTNLNISFARKLTLALFTNTALITFFVEIIFFRNYYGIGGGMIYGEYLVFINNAIIPALAWIIDPWSIWKNFKRNKELKKGNQSTLTQKQANILMEHPDYAMGKRYADIMKTMWFTFFYSPVIPMATVWSILGVILYYITDKYNLIYRRTVKESIGKGLTIEMIEMVEYCVVLHCFGNFFFKYQLFGTYELSNLILCCATLLISILPMQELNDWLFPSNSQSEQKNYREVEIYFDSDYDRENPVTRNYALKSLMMTRSRILKEASEASKIREKDNFILLFDESDIYKWRAFVFGPEDSAYSEGIFEIKINLNQNYPIQAPQMIFKTRIFHPNIHWETGEICLDIIKDQWTPSWTLESLCRAIQQLMSNPNANSPLNCDAGNLVRSGDMTGYISLARMLTDEYAISKEEFKKMIQIQDQFKNYQVSKYQTIIFFFFYFLCSLVYFIK